MQYKLLVNGFENMVDFTSDEIEQVHRPLLSRLTALHRAKKRRIICLFAAAPGAGKSTTAAFWEMLSKKDSDLEIVQTLSIDGFHYPNQYLDAHTIVWNGKTVKLKSIKGAPETYNVDALEKSMVNLAAEDKVSWPYYDRNIHDPIPNSIQVRAPIVVIEGNWVLLNEGVWARLKDYADLTVFQDAQEAMLKDRLIERKIRGGVSVEEAEAHYKRSDSMNICKVREQHLEAEAVIRWDSNMDQWCLDF